MNSLPLPFDEIDPLQARLDARDRAGRERAVDPRFNVALEASAGTGKTRVLVDRYINLLRAGVDPSNILAITFTRKAAAEMRDRIMTTLRAAAARGEIAPARWRELRDRTADIGISTIDAFCLSLLREFPLEAGLDPGFSIADETEIPRLVDESLDRTLRIGRRLAREDEDVALAFAQLGERRLRTGLAALLNRRVVAPDALARYLASGPRELDVARAGLSAATGIIGLLESMPGGIEGFLASGPPEPSFVLVTQAVRTLADHAAGQRAVEPGRIQSALARVRDHFLTQDGEPRSRSPYAKSLFAMERDWQVQRHLVVEYAPRVAATLQAYRRDLNVIVSRGIQRLFRVADTQYGATLERHAVLDFSDLLLRALALLRQMEEFSRSRYRLESRYHHVLVDEFQDTSRAQWELISLLVQSWGAGSGLAHEGPLPPSIFIVGDRKQSIYGFRDADVSVLREAAHFLEGLRPEAGVRQSISRSFRATPSLLAFINDVCIDVEKAPGRRDAFQYDEPDRFPIEHDAGGPEAPTLIAADTPEACAAITATEIAGLLERQQTVRDRETGVRRSIRAGDIAILFRTRDSHREFEAALEARGVAAYVYKGLGFFDADEIKDVLALLWYLADPLSELRAAALLRSRLVGLSDDALRRLAPRLADALRGATPPAELASLDPMDQRALIEARSDTLRWRSLVDRVPPAELLDLVLSESAYDVELRGPRFAQARENLKKMRALIRRIQNRGYATLGRIAEHLDRLAVGDESNAVIDAFDAVHLMTIHAAKGLEFPVVFVVNLARGTGNRRDPVRLADAPADGAASVAVGDFQSDADADAQARDREETKRLLYVALTRARDRLYLATVLKDGRVQPGRGSLADVMPASLLECFSLATTGQIAEWRASGAGVHRLQACAVTAEAAGSATAPAPAFQSGQPAPSDVTGDFVPIADAAIPRRTVGTATGVQPEGIGAEGRGSDRVVGTLVHRLLQRFGLDAPVEAELLRDAATRMLREDGLTLLPEVGVSAFRRTDGAGDSDDCVDRAIEAYRSIVQHPDVRTLHGSGTWMHEVPFTLLKDGVLLRGTIDCLIQLDDRVVILEFKTGRARPEHRLQLDLYRQAVQHLFAGVMVEDRLVYSAPAMMD